MTSYTIVEKTNCGLGTTSYNVLIRYSSLENARKYLENLRSLINAANDLIVCKLNENNDIVSYIDRRSIWTTYTYEIVVENFDLKDKFDELDLKEIKEIRKFEK